MGKKMVVAGIVGAAAVAAVAYSKYSKTSGNGNSILNNASALRNGAFNGAHEDDCFSSRTGGKF